MKATDLMIGDYVQFYDSERKLRYEKVTAIRDEGNDWRYVQTAESDVFYREETYMPIPLTTDILDKNNFMYSATNQGYIRFTPLAYNKLIGGDVLVKFQAGSAQVFVHEGIGLIGFNGTVSYIHELQHILRNFVEWEITI